MHFFTYHMIYYYDTWKIVYHIVQAKLSALKTATFNLQKDQEQCIKYIGLTVRYIEKLTISTTKFLISLIFSEP